MAAGTLGGMDENNELRHRATDVKLNAVQAEIAQISMAQDMLSHRVTSNHQAVMERFNNLDEKVAGFISEQRAANAAILEAIAGLSTRGTD